MTFKLEKLQLHEMILRLCRIIPSLEPAEVRRIGANFFFIAYAPGFKIRLRQLREAYQCC